MPLAEQSAAIELFRGTMMRHSAVLHLEPQAPLDFSGDGWLRFVPHRLPDTLCIHERLPAGAAGVLINRTHMFRDIHLAASAPEVEMYEAIDGRRTIAQLSGQRDREVARRFFE